MNLRRNPEIRDFALWVPKPGMGPEIRSPIQVYLSEPAFRETDPAYFEIDEES